MTSVLFVLKGEQPHPLVVLFPVVFVQIQGLLLRGAIGVRLVSQQLLNSQQQLTNCYVGLPVLLVVEDGETYRSRGVYVWVRENWLEDTLWRSTLGDKVPDGVVVGKVHGEAIDPSFPD